MPPTLNQIEMRWRTTSSGVCVIVEGETERDDPWFFHKWFSDCARDVTFFPHDGWDIVIQSVTDLRTTLGVKKVYGIIDRDFETPVNDPFPADGVLRLHKYTLENYLLDPSTWFKVVQPFIQRDPKPGWGTETEAQATIEALYRECIPLAAYNWTLHTARNQAPAVVSAQPANKWSYATHPNQLKQWGDIPARLQLLQTDARLTENLAQLYTDHQTSLQAQPFAQLETLITGKTVLKLLRETFPLQPIGKRWDDMLSAYMYHNSTPQPDMAKLIDLILKDAHA